MTPSEFRAVRKTLSLTQDAFGAMIGISRDQVSRIENGAPITPTMALAVRAIALLGPPETWPDRAPA